MLSIVLMSRAHEESAAKAKRLRSVWSQKKRGASTKPVTAQCPRWLRLKTDRSGFEIIPELAESVRKVYAMRLKGFGYGAIAHRANQEKWPIPSKSARFKTWYTSLVTRTLTNRAVLGEYQPHTYNSDKREPEGDPIPGYYPVVIDEQTFLRAHAVSAKQDTLPNRRDRAHRNFLHGLLQCGPCSEELGRRVALVRKTHATIPDYTRYYCSRRVVMASDCKTVRASDLDYAVLGITSMLRPDAFTSHEHADSIRAEIDAQAAALTDLRARLDKLVHAIEVSASEKESTTIAARVRELEAQEQGIERALATAKAQEAELQNESIREGLSYLREATALLTTERTAIVPEDEWIATRQILLRVINQIDVHTETATPYIVAHIQGDPHPWGPVPIEALKWPSGKRKPASVEHTAVDPKLEAIYATPGLDLKEFASRLKQHYPLSPKWMVVHQYRNYCERYSLVSYRAMKAKNGRVGVVGYDLQGERVYGDWLLAGSRSQEQLMEEAELRAQELQSQQTEVKQES